jgi:hypothetical protein
VYGDNRGRRFKILNYQVLNEFLKASRGRLLKIAEKKVSVYQGESKPARFRSLLELLTLTHE